MKTLFKIYILIFIFIISAIGYLYFSLEKTQDELTININNIFISQAKDMATNIQEEIVHYVPHHLYETLKKDSKLCDFLEETISPMTNNSFQYIFVLYRDKDGSYRYLIDGSKGEEKGEFSERLNVEQLQWDSVYNKKRADIFTHKEFTKLWMTYLKPIIIDGKTEAIIAIDFSTKIPKEVSSVITPLNNIFYYIFIAVFIILIILLYQTVLNIKTKKASITDHLTQVYNRQYLRELLESINISKYQIIMLDIDHFKNVNDLYGHKVGDYVLRDIATIIKNEIRSDDILVRYGGEEFLLFIHKEEKEKHSLAQNIAERIRKKIEKHSFQYDECSLNTTISMGITCHANHFKSISDAIANADKMLYIAKRDGRNKVVTQENSDYVPHVDMQNLSINEIKDAIEKKHLFCQYQALFNAKTNQITKYEALVRLKDNDNKTIYPNRFITTVLHTNIYNQMTKEILDIVFEKIAQNRVAISVNLNFSDIINTDIFKIITGELEKNAELAPWLIVELLEYELLEADETFAKNIQTIRSFGVKIAIDDFGAGFANYNVFQIIPIDIVKIDGSLIKNIDTSKTSKIIVKSIIVLTQELGIDTVAEFVHSKEVYEIVKSLGVTTIQGFYLAQPQNELLSTL